MVMHIRLCVCVCVCECECVSVCTLRQATHARPITITPLPMTIIFRVYKKQWPILQARDGS